MTYKLLYGQPESAIEWTGNFDAYFVALDTWGQSTDVRVWNEKRKLTTG